MKECGRGSVLLCYVPYTHTQTNTNTHTPWTATTRTEFMLYFTRKYTMERLWQNYDENFQTKSVCNKKPCVPHHTPRECQNPETYQEGLKQRVSDQTS
jgi:hypothetical protein